MHQRLNLNIPQKNTFLLPRDILAIADRLIGMKFGMGTLDNMNHLKNKCIHSVADLLQDQFGLALYATPSSSTFSFREVHYWNWVERQVALDSGVPTIADHEGKIISTDTDKIILSRNGDALGKLLVDGATTVGGKLALGKNVLVAKESSYALEDRLLRAILGIQKHEIKVGDKIAGRHRNKWIISKILPRQDMPYLQDGRPVDMVFNPLGIPSRMNVEQLFECLLGLAGTNKQTANPWVFEPKYPGKSRIFYGRTGSPFEQLVKIGKPYILKLIHQVDDKIHGCSSGHYALVTQQPLRRRSKQGGQRVGEIEVWALEGFGVAHIFQEMLTYKSHHIGARQEVLGTTIIGGTIPKPKDALESF
ncbi:hypothetical protein Goshw_020714 [Gossypium schwendimanii]|uniref:DNA-directed RNA polymerase n=2 Tax=Gossypium schwendimanii TaxID=34291 RepID=A0A7J9MZG7_GOSSC|nr:hypothetical protein [Gossypium schwendimanii]